MPSHDPLPMVLGFETMLVSLLQNLLENAIRYRSKACLKRLHGSDRPGNGLGLAICRRVVERHNRRIWVESQAGQGATFYFTLNPAK